MAAVYDGMRGSCVLTCWATTSKEFRVFRYQYGEKSKSGPLPTRGEASAAARR
jgi:hypothetical protein